MAFLEKICSKQFFGCEKSEMVCSETPAVKCPVPIRRTSEADSPSTSSAENSMNLLVTVTPITQFGAHLRSTKVSG